MKHERSITEYRRVKYQPRAMPDKLSAGTGHTFLFARTDEESLVYVEGYIKMKPSNMRICHSWVFDPDNRIRYELDRLEALKGLENGESVLWDLVEDHGHEIAKEEMQKAGRPPVLSDSDPDPIWKKLTKTRVEPCFLCFLHRAFCVMTYWPFGSKSDSVSPLPEPTTRIAPNFCSPCSSGQAPTPKPTDCGMSGLRAYGMHSPEKQVWP